MSFPVLSDKWLAEMANITRQNFLASTENHTVLLRKHFKAADVVIGIFPDDKPGKLGRATLKGLEVMRAIAMSNTSRDLKVVVISCREYAEAVAMNHVFGDGSL